MATVYLAEDLKHGRKVAIKVLRPELATAIGPERFLREIKLTAGLEHPHILTLHDSGEADGLLYYVMPYIEGESLRDRIAEEGKLPAPDAVRILRNVVDALAYAHGLGVVHRDVKPDNVLLSGRHAMVTDFGIAKAVSEAGGQQGLTSTGITLGTPAYMAPEQVAADPHIDHRADIYAVGAMAYEILTGQPPFTGTSAQEVLSAHVIKQPEPVRTKVPGVPAALDQLVMRCLEKRPVDRWQTAEEMLPHLEAVTASGTVTPSRTTAVGAALSRHGRKVAVLTGVVVAIAVLGFLGWSSLSRAGPAVTVSNIRQLTRAREIELQPAISPDGREVVYMAGVGSGYHLFLRDRGGGRSLPLTADRPGTQILPRWTSDGSGIVFFEYGSDIEPGAHLIPRRGGPTRRLGSRAIWGVHGDRVVYTQRDSIFVRLLEGGEPTFVAYAPPDPHSLIWSADGSKLAYVQGNFAFISVADGDLGNVAPSSIWIVPVDGGDPAQVTDHPSLNVSPVWLPDGRHLLFVSNRDGARDVYVLPIDGAGRPRGEPIRVTTGLDPHSVSVSADGSTVIYSRFMFRRNVWAIAIPETGSVSISEATPVTVGNQIVENHGVSVDGRWLTFDANLEGSQDIYVMPVEGGEPRRVTWDPGADFHPDFSLDTGEIVFYSSRHGSRDLFLVTTEGTNEVRLTADPGEERHPAFSPDGLRIAFESTGTGRYEIDVVRRDSVGGTWSDPRQLTRAGGHLPRWSPDGRQIVYEASNAIGIMSLNGKARRLLDGDAAGLFRIGFPDWHDGFIYFSGADSAGVLGIYQMPAEGGWPRLVVRFDDPTKDVWLPYSVGDNKIFLSLAEYESDIYAMDLSTK
jgi:serine/threonine-protein kinase